MTWYYASGGQQMGPVDEAVLDDLVRQGVVRDDTLVWRQGLPGWQAHRMARPQSSRAVASAPSPAPVPGPAEASAAAEVQAGAPPNETRFCSNCGRPTPAAQMSTVSGAAVCADCFPLLAGPAGPTVAAGSAASPYAPPPAYYPQAPAGYAPGGYAPVSPYMQAAVPGQVRYAGFWIRFLARIIDGILLAIVSSIIRIPLMLMMGGLGLGLSSTRDPTAILAAVPAFMSLLGLSFLIQFAISILYEVYFVSTRGATLGKIVLGLKIVRADGGPVSAGLAAGRYFASMLSAFTFMIGYIIAGFDDQKRALHDRICDTRVIKL